MKFDELVEIMARLRHAEKGCPWDLKQTPETLKPYLIEETYEVAEAIDDGVPKEIRDELGDLLFQILFQSRIQEERNEFDINDVIEAIGTKMRRRHPHIFGNAVANTVEEVKVRWEEIKKTEFTDRKSVLDGVPKSLPSMLRARRIGKKAANVGFDWPQLNGAWEKTKEEISELESVLSSGEKDRIFHEFGDLLFSLVNVARHIDVNPEDALNAATNRFIGRFEYIEKKLAEIGKKFEGMPLEALDVFWEEAKTKVG